MQFLKRGLIFDKKNSKIECNEITDKNKRDNTIGRKNAHYVCKKRGFQYTHNISRRN